jgi:hypothetical protein
MEPIETNIGAIAEGGKETVKPTSPEPTKTISESQSITATVVDDTLKGEYDILKEVKQLWGNYFGEGKKTNLMLAIAIISTIPVIIAASVVLDFLNRLPLLPSIFELVGFGYSARFVYRYLLLANTRKELIDGITAWRSKIFG